MAQYLIFNGAMQTTAKPPTVATGTSIKTLMQVKPSATLGARIKAWGIAFDASAAATPGSVELFESDVAATVTAYVANDLTKYDALAVSGGDPTTNLIQVGTSASGYTATAEGSTTASRSFDLQLVAPTNQYVRHYPLGMEPFVQKDKFLRVRVHFGTTVNALCWVLLEL